MKKNEQHGAGFGPDASERMNEYWDDSGLDEDMPWHARRTGGRKSKPRGKTRNDLRPSTPDVRPEDELSEDSYLE